jgi:hypothetical protein
MGTTCFTPEPGLTTEQILRREFGGEAAWEIVGLAVRKAEFHDVGIRSSVAYMAVRTQKHPAVFGVVVLIDRRGGEFCYKEMDEAMGPNEDHCPENILNKLDQIGKDDDPMGYAHGWRARCWANLGKSYVMFKTE